MLTSRQVLVARLEQAELGVEDCKTSLDQLTMQNAHRMDERESDSKKIPTLVEKQAQVTAQHASIVVRLNQIDDSTAALQMSTRKVIAESATTAVSLQQAHDKIEKASGSSQAADRAERYEW